MLESDQFGQALHVYPEGVQPLDQQLLVLVLRENHRKRKRTESVSHFLDGNGRGLGAIHPQVERRDFMTAIHERLSESHLLIELKRARLHRQCARSGSRPWRFIDKAHFDAHMREPEREDEPGRPCAHNQNRLVRHDEESTAQRRWVHALARALRPIQLRSACRTTSARHCTPKITLQNPDGWWLPPD